VKGAENGLDAIQAQVDAQRELVGRLSPVARGQWLEFNTLLAGYLLSTQGDRMTMAHSVESRCPFLDPNVVEWAHSQPLDYKLKNGNLEKHILKAAFLRDLPRAIVERPKQPYRAPNSAAFLGKDPPDYLESVLSGSELAKLDFLEHDLASRLVRKVTSTSPDLVSPREDQAFIFLLSLGVIHSQFCGQRQVSPLIEDILIRRIDGRCRLDITQGGEGNS
jgi:asparagine synthase (glutamine-hydrolysing)